MFYITQETGRHAVYGGAFLGAGGGGSLEGGLGAVRDALAAGTVRVLEIGDFSPLDVIVTASLVGSPSAGGAGVTAEDCSRAYRLFVRGTGISPAGIITNESGAHSITNGWIAAAANGLPMLDAACNGRAHPTGAMGAMSLAAQADYVTTQAAVGGTGEKAMELLVRGGIASASAAVRNASILAEGFVTVLRNPVTADYIGGHAALGTLSMCIRLGRLLCDNHGDIEAILAGLQGECGVYPLARGRTEGCFLRQEGGFDVGGLTVDGVEISFWNEFLTADRAGQRLATFPDLIALLDAHSGMPITSAQVADGMEVVAVAAPRGRMLLGSSMGIPQLFAPCEKAIGKEIVKYVFE